LMAHADKDPCSVCVSNVVAQKNIAQPSCALHAERASQQEAVGRLLTLIPSLSLNPERPLLSTYALLQAADAFAKQPDCGSLCSKVERDSKYSTGPKVWPAAVGLCNALGGNSLLPYIDGAEVIELGCGLGLPGLTTLLCGAERVTLTDCGDDVEKVLDVAMSSAFCSWKTSGRLCYQRLAWSSSNAEEILQACAFDIVLCADCVYEPFFGEESWQLLADTLAVLLRTGGHRLQRSPLAILSVERRIEGVDGVDSFLDALKAHSLCVRSLPHTEGAPGRSNSDAGIADNDVEIFLVTAGLSLFPESAKLCCARHSAM